MMHEAKLRKEDLDTIKTIAKLLMGMCPESDLIEEMGMQVITMVNDIKKNWESFPENKREEALHLLEEGLKKLPVSMRKMSMSPDFQEQLRKMKES